MNTTFYCLFGFIILSLSNRSLAQESEKPFFVSPLIGDTLSLEERDYYNLLPTINGFQFAIFYLNSDSTLDVRVSYKTRSGIRDTIISKYKSLGNLKIHLFKVDIETARKVVVYSFNKNTLSGSLVTISESSALIFNEDCNGNDFSNTCFSRINNTDINKFIIEGESDIGLTTLWGTLIGLGAGSIIGGIGEIVYTGDSSSPYGGVGIYYGAIIGTIVGLVGGFIYGYVTSTPDIIIEPFSEDDIKGLSQYAIFPYGEPDELKKIK